MAIKKITKQFEPHFWYALCDKHRDEAISTCGGRYNELDKDEVISTCDFSRCERKPKWEYYPK